MTIKTLTTIAIVSAALSGPVFAQEAGPDGMSHQRSVQAQRHFRGAYDQAPMGAYDQAPVNGPSYIGPGAEDGWTFGSFGRDRSRPGGLDPDLRPSGS